MYEIKILSNKEFDKLPKSVTRGSDISDSLGFADPVTGKAYVRYTAHPELQKYLIDHEFNHLLEEEKTDVDENGICHKKFFKEIFLPTFTGYNAQSGKWSPFGILDPSIRKNSDGSDMSQAQLQQDSLNKMFGDQGPLNRFTGSKLQNSQASGNLGGDLQGGLNQGLKSFGQSTATGLPPEFLERLRGFFGGRIAF